MNNYILTGLSVGEITAIIGAVLAILTSVIIPLYKYFNKKHKDYEKNVQKLVAVDKQVDSLISQIDKVTELCNTLAVAQTEMNNTCKDLLSKMDRFETQQLKHIINDAFLGYDCIEEIPDEILIGASQSCDIYVGKGLNHETGSRCKLIYKELERRQILKAHPQEGDHHE